MRGLNSSHFLIEGRIIMKIDKESIKENFNEDIDNIKKRHSTTTYYIKDQGKLKLRNENTPDNLNTA